MLHKIYIFDQNGNNMCLYLRMCLEFIHKIRMTDRTSTHKSICQIPSFTHVSLGRSVADLKKSFKQQDWTRSGFQTTSLKLISGLCNWIHHCLIKKQSCNFYCEIYLLWNSMQVSQHWKWLRITNRTHNLSSFSALQITEISSVKPMLQVFWTI